jgi:hypothetical protein
MVLVTSCNWLILSERGVCLQIYDIKRYGMTSSLLLTYVSQLVGL